MTEPTNDPDATDSRDVSADVPTAQQPPVPPFAAQPFAGQPFAGQPFAGQPLPGQSYPPAFAAPYPFAPVAKEPWINPAKKTTVLVAAIVLTVVLLGCGFLIGAATGDQHGRRGVGVNGPFRGVYGQLPAGGFQYGQQVPGQVTRRAPVQVNPVPAAPSGSATPSRSATR